jgi:hypothetical protein
MKNTFIYLTAAFVSLTQLTACDSGANGQIEKCVQSLIAASGPYKNNAEKVDAEAHARLMCLRASTGKD